MLVCHFRELHLQDQPVGEVSGHQRKNVVGSITGAIVSLRILSLRAAPTFGVEPLQLISSARVSDF